MNIDLHITNLEFEANQLGLHLRWEWDMALVGRTLENIILVLPDGTERGVQAADDWPHRVRSLLEYYSSSNYANRINPNP